MFEYDLETTPLEIQTDSGVDSNEQLGLDFFNAEEQEAGGVWIKFGATVQYSLSFCSIYSDFSTTLPTSATKIWRVTLKRTSDVPTVLIHCNNEKVVDVQLSDSVCTNAEWASSWRNYWSRKVEKVVFSTSDTASDHYRFYKGE